MGQDDPEKLRQLYEARNRAVWGDARLAKSNRINVQLDGSLQMASDWQENGGCLAGLLIFWFSSVAKMVGWSKDDINASLENGKQLAKLRKNIGEDFKDDGEITVRFQIKIPTLFNRKRK